MKPEEPDRHEPVDGPDEAWAAVRTAEPGGMCRDELAELLTNVKRARACLDAVELRAARRARELAAVGASEPAESLLTGEGGHDSRDAAAVTDRDQVCDDLPDVESALDTGGLTAAHVDAIATARKRLPEVLRGEFDAMVENLIARAGRVSIDTFRRECRQLASQLIARTRPADVVDELAEQRNASKVTRWVDRDTGMHHTHLELDTVRDAKLYATMQAELARLRQAQGSNTVDWQQLQVDAFVNTIAGITTPVANHDDGDNGDNGDGGGSPRPVDRVPEITVLVSYDWLTGQVASGVCETEDGVPLPIHTMRRLCCDAEIIPTVLGGTGEVLDHGRSRRTANRAQRRALRAMHRGCVFPDCQVGFSACRIHHIRWWWRDLGPSDIANMVPVCEQHHHLVHEGRWTLTMTPDRTATWTRPDGTLHHHGTTIDRRPPPDTASTDPTESVESGRPASETSGHNRDGQWQSPGQGERLRPPARAERIGKGVRGRHLTIA